MNLDQNHNGTSILENIPNLDMVKDFPLDPMHLLHLGVVKKICTPMVSWCPTK